MPGRLAGKVAIVTGGARGIGLAAVELFCREGAAVVIADRDAGAGKEAEARVKAQGGRALAIHTDVTKPPMVEALVRKTVEAFGKIDVLYNNAGYSIVEKVGAADLPIEIWHETIDVNLNGSFYCSKFAIPYMLENGAGSIINTGSVAVDGALEYNAYAVAKGALIPLTRTLAMQYLPQNIRVNMIVPGGTKTERIVDRFAKEGRTEGYNERALLGMNDPIDVAYGALYFASDESRKVTGQVLHVDSGYSLHWHSMQKKG